jgi:pimeloyl-ACP methyl ester carboxylesterase
VDEFERDGLRFPVADGGPSGAPPTILLHGFPGGATTWSGVVPRLHHAALRTLVPTQRGYAASARPSGVGAYVVPELVADIVALADAAGLEQVHVVGHDWGGVVAWALAAWHPDRIATLTVLSTPHPGALVSSLTHSTQALRSTYVAGFQVPVLPESVLLARNGALLRRLLHRTGLSEAWADDYVKAMREPGALTGALNWYRALLRQPRVAASVGTVAVPTRYLWSSGDESLGRVAASETGRHVRASYRFEVAEGAPHWLPEERPQVVARHVLEQTGVGAAP